jgi:hypothetical protein
MLERNEHEEIRKPMKRYWSPADPIRGLLMIEFDSAAEAAANFDVTQSAIQHAVRRGYRCAGRIWYRNGSNENHCQVFAVAEGNHERVDFKSIKAAAEYSGVTRNAIAYAIRHEYRSGGRLWRYA